MLMDSVGQTLRQGRAEMTCLCSVMYEASAEELKGWGWSHLKQGHLMGLSVMLKTRCLHSPLGCPLTTHGGSTTEIWLVQ